MSQGSTREALDFDSIGAAAVQTAGDPFPMEMTTNLWDLSHGHGFQYSEEAEGIQEKISKTHSRHCYCTYLWTRL